MTFVAALGWIKEAAIIAALGWVVWFLYHSGEDRVKLADLKAVQQQIADNTKQEAQWRATRDTHDAQLKTQLDGVSTAIAANHRPVIVQDRPSSLPAATAKAGSSDPSAGGANPPAGKDIRPELNQFELTLERVVTDCHKLEDPHQ